MKRRKKLIDILEKKAMSGYALARAVGYQPQTVYNWIYGSGTPSPEAMLKMTKILNVSAEEILKIFAEKEEK